MKRLIYINILLFTTWTELCACSCAPIKKEDRKFYKEYEFVDDVFIGEVKNFDDDSINYAIEICEVFKGNLRPGQLIQGVNEGYCEPFVDKNGEWMFLGHYSDTFEVNDCGLTTDLDEPWSIFPPPPIPEEYKDDRDTWYENLKSKARKEAYRQIEILRNKKEKGHGDLFNSAWRGERKPE